jgi:ubiquinone biosynthesis protein UbiJ
MLQGFINRALRTAVARAMQDSSRARELCSQLDGRSVRIDVTGGPWQLLLTAQQAQLDARVLPAGIPAPADARISGSVVALLGALGEGQRALLQSGALRIEGDAELAQRCSELLQLLRPDVEQELGRVLGPIPAHLLWRGARSLWDQGQSLLRDQSRNAADWLAHERRTLVSVPEAEHRYREIEAAREQLDRIDARLRGLEQRP